MSLYEESIYEGTCWVLVRVVVVSAEAPLEALLRLCTAEHLTRQLLRPFSYRRNRSAVVLLSLLNAAAISSCRL